MTRAHRSLLPCLRYPDPPGGPLDVVARALAEEFKDTLGVVVVDNRPGADGSLGADFVARLNRAFVDGLNSPQIKQRLARLMAAPSPTGPEQFGDFIKAELATYEPVVKATSATAN